jgi:hypothetical protein
MLSIVIALVVGIAVGHFGTSKFVAWLKGEEQKIAGKL